MEMKREQITANEIVELIHDHYARNPQQKRQHVFLDELRLGSGFSNDSERRADVFMIDSGEGNLVTIFEIKLTRQDFLKDIKNPLKQRGARQYANLFYYVAPEGLIKPEELPIWAGLKEVAQEQWWLSLKNTIVAPYYEKTLPTWRLICAIIRHLNRRVMTNGINT